MESSVSPRLYELVGLIAGSLNEKDVQRIVEDVKKLVSKAEGSITVEDLWPRRTLAYPIAHEVEASYLVLNFTVLPSALKGLNKTLRLESKLLRFLLVQMPDTYTYVSPSVLAARAAEAKESLAPGLEAPKRRTSTPSRAKPAAAKPTVVKKPAETPKVEGAKGKDYDTQLDSALKNIDQSL